VARGFRTPNIAELGSNGVHEGTFRYEVGNRDLRSETSLQADAGITIYGDHGHLQIEAFSNQINNYIYLQKLLTIGGTDSVIDAGDPAPAFKFIQGDAHLYGGEISSDIHPHPLDWLHFENSIAIVRAVQKGQPDSMRYLPFIPVPKFRSELKAEMKRKTKFLRNGYARVQWEYNAEQDQFYSAFGTETYTPAYSLLNAGLGGDIINSKERTLFSLYCAANNLLDVNYQSHLSRLKYAPVNPLTGRQGVFNMGRNFSVKVVVPLEW
jgi:iron complex outermembrane receptor protein